MSYPDMSTELLSKYIGSDEIPKEDLRSIITTACGAFRSEEVTPVKKVGDHYVLEVRVERRSDEPVKVPL